MQATTITVLGLPCALTDLNRSGRPIQASNCAIVLSPSPGIVSSKAALLQVRVAVDGALDLHLDLRYGLFQIGDHALN